MDTLTDKSIFFKPKSQPTVGKSLSCPTKGSPTVVINHGRLNLDCLKYFLIYTYAYRIAEVVQKYAHLTVIIKTVHVFNEIKIKRYHSVFNHCWSKLKGKFTNTSLPQCTAQDLKANQLKQKMPSTLWEEKDSICLWSCLLEEGLRTNCCQFS